MESLRIKEENSDQAVGKKELRSCTSLEGAFRTPLKPMGELDSWCRRNSNSDRHFCEVRKFRIRGRSQIMLFLFIIFYRGKIYFSYKLILYKYNCILCNVVDKWKKL